MLNKGERYSRVPRLPDTRYSATGIKGRRTYASSKARLECAARVPDRSRILGRKRFLLPVT